ncbi:MFS transporter [Paenibacillus sp. SC116]|uniref:MFS transporter n=1 Tax=Paenibacillus sp. SC116 TaxID=2968986 RepID=UPI00215B2891|nr:MFS transporter [Paenibacillus sp. SC116]MCR8843448.1 MFS transporter [Paenibacillus sp. SC116]
MKNKLLSNRPFIFFYLSRTSANIADSIYTVVLLYFIQSVTESVSYTSFTYSAMSATAMLSFLVGPLVDRHSPLKIASISLLVQAIIIFSVPFLIGVPSFGMMLVLALVFVASCFSLLFYPANNKLIPILMGSQDEIVKANSLINSTDQVINIIGYLVGASIIVWIGMNNTFFLASGLLLLAGLIYLRMSQRLTIPTLVKEDSAKESSSYFTELKEGFSFVKGNVIMRSMLPFYALINFLLAIVIITLPSLGVAAGSPIYYSLIYIAFFIGVISGSILTNHVPKKGFVIALAWIFMGISLCVFAIVQGIWLKMGGILLMGISTGLINVLQTSLIQISTPTNLLGRVMSFLQSISFASMPLGALIGGMLTLRYPLETVLTYSGVLIIASGLILACIKTIRTLIIQEEPNETQQQTVVAESSDKSMEG